MSRVLSRVASSLYELIVSARNSCFDRGILRERIVPEVRLVCFGNVTVGGSGKSPLTLYIAHQLVSQSIPVCILTRGYGGSLCGPVVVDESHGTHEVGDEALQFFYRTNGAVPVVVCRDRYRGASFIAKKGLATHILMDDGYQHRALWRNENILLIENTLPGVTEADVTEPMLPAGRLREPFQSAVRRATAIMLVERTTLTESARNELREKWSRFGLPVFSISFEPEGVFAANSNDLVDYRSFAGKRCVALATIAQPENFFSMIECVGIKVAEKKAFRDHYQLSRAQWQKIAAAGDIVITTEKDLPKLRDLDVSLSNCYYLRLATKFPILDDHSQLLAHVCGS